MKDLKEKNQNSRNVKENTTKNTRVGELKYVLLSLRFSHYRISSQTQKLEPLCAG